MTDQPHTDRPLSARWYFVTGDAEYQRWDFGIPGDPYLETHNVPTALVQSVEERERDRAGVLLVGDVQTLGSLADRLVAAEQREADVRARLDGLATLFHERNVRCAAIHAATAASVWGEAERAVRALLEAVPGSGCAVERCGHPEARHTDDGVCLDCRERDPEDWWYAHIFESAVPGSPKDGE